MKKQWGTGATSSAGAKDISCSFCQRSRDQARYLLTGPGVSICEVCVATCVETIADSERAKRGRPAARGRLYRYVMALLWKGVPLPARIHCDLCRARVAIADSAPVARRGRLCRDCIAAVQEATRRDTKESH